MHYSNRCLHGLLVALTALVTLTLLCAEIVAAENIGVISPMTNCSGCISFALYTCSNCRSNFDCSSRTASDGTVGSLAIIRSQRVQDFISTALDLSKFVKNAVDGHDIQTEGVWRYETGEIFSYNGTAAEYAFANWNAGEPNNYGLGGEQYLYLQWSITAWRWNDDKLSAQRIICMFEHQLGVNRLVDPSGVSDTFGINASTAVYSRFEAFPEHVTQATAFARCESLQRVDPNRPGSGVKVAGVLAVAYTKFDWDAIISLLQEKSDIKWHSAAANFGAWVGANSTVTGADTNWQPEGRRTTQILLLRHFGGAAGAFSYGTFDGPATANSGVAIATAAVGASQWKMVWHSVTKTLPLVCRFSFNPAASIRITIPPSAPPCVSATNPLLNTTLPAHGGDNKLTTFLVRYYAEWRTTDEARAHCWSKIEKNELGDEVRGLSGVLLMQPEWDAVLKLVQGSGYLASGAQLTQSMKGIFLDVKTATNVDWDTLETLRQRNVKGLVFNRGGSLPFTPTSLPWEARMYRGDDGNCMPGQACPTLQQWDADIADAATVLAFGESGNTFTATASRRRPYVCVHKFPVRARLAPWLTVEYHAFPMRWSDAKTVCEARTNLIPSLRGGQGALLLEEVRGFFGYFPRAVLGKLKQWASEVVGGGSSHEALRYAPRVRTGTRRKVDEKNMCEVWLVGTSSLQFEECDDPMEFVCQFVFPNFTASLSRSKSNTSFLRRAKTATNITSLSQSISVIETGSESSTSTPSHPTLSASKTPFAVESRSPSLSVPDSESLSDDRSASFSSSVLRTTSGSASASVTPSLTASAAESHSKATLTASRTVAPTSSTSRSAGDGIGTLTDSAPSPSQPSPSRSPPPATESDSGPTQSIFFPDVYARPEAIRALQDIASIASLFSGGAIAVQRSRLEAADALSRCGDPHQRLDEPPDFMASPFKLQVPHDDETVATRYMRGQIPGNALAILVSSVVMYAVGSLFGLAYYKGNWRKGLEALRLPGLAMVPISVLVAPSVQASSTLLIHDNGAIARLFGIAGVFFFVGISFAILFQVSRLVVSGLVTIRTLPPAASRDNICKKKLGQSECGRAAIKLARYLFTSEIGWVGASTITEYLDLVSAKKNNATTAGASDSKMEAMKAHLALQSKEATKGETFLLHYGAIFEDFGYVPPSADGNNGCVAKCLGCSGDGGGRSDHAHRHHEAEEDKSWGFVTCGFFSAIDLFTSIALGWCAGVAAGALSHSGCVFWLSAATTAAAYHSFVLVYYRPCLVRATAVYMTLASLLTTATVALSFANYMTRYNFASNPRYSNVVDKIMLAQAGLGIFATFFSLGSTIMLLIEFCDGVLTGRDLEALEKHTREKLSLYVTGSAAQEAAMRGAGGVGAATAALNSYNGRGGGGGGGTRAPNYDVELAILVTAMSEHRNYNRAGVVVPTPAHHSSHHNNNRSGTSSATRKVTFHAAPAAFSTPSAVPMSPRTAVKRQLYDRGDDDDDDDDDDLLRAAKTATNTPNDDRGSNALTHPLLQKQRQEQQQQQQHRRPQSRQDVVDDDYAALLGSDDEDHYAVEDGEETETEASTDLAGESKPRRAKRHAGLSVEDIEADEELESFLGKL